MNVYSIHTQMLKFSGISLYNLEEGYVTHIYNMQLKSDF